MPTSKTASPDSYHEHISYMLTHLNRLLMFYGRDTARCHFQLYQSRKRAPEMVVNILTHGAAKYNKSKRKKNEGRMSSEEKRRRRSPIRIRKNMQNLTQQQRTKLKWKPLPFQEEKEKCPLVIFVDGVFGKDMVKPKNIRCGAVGKLYLTLKKREAAGELIYTHDQAIRHWTMSTPVLGVYGMNKEQLVEVINKYNKKNSTVHFVRLGFSRWPYSIHSRC
ncbi:hypothetical protein [Parasitella parasitica]|uniref:Uncharacterized protein n=1 Tax=Parasitella parasitica TaxID=35722 RepID=A0A0B7N2Z4_9FUNG|nr:hypothetical protein [Parasitella parasitica]